MEKVKQGSIPTYTGLSVLVKLGANVAGAEGAVGGVLTVMRTTSIVFLTAVDNLHLNTCREANVNHKCSA